MNFEIQENEIANKDHFNFYLKKNYDLISISYKGDKVLISANISETQKNEIITFYDLLNGDFTSDDEYLESFLIDKYKINADKGLEYVFLITAKLGLLIQHETITIVEAETYGAVASNVFRELERGYWHSAFNYAFNYTPISSISNLHNDLLYNIKDYVNTEYPEEFHIE